MLIKLYFFILSFILKMIGFKKRLFLSLEKIKRSKGVFYKIKTNKRIHLDKINISGYWIYTFIKRSPNQKEQANKHIIFFHGGGYVFEAVSGHKKLIFDLINLLDVKISFFDYPLAPANTYIQTFNMLNQGYLNLCEKYPYDQFILMGDSAGGGLALAFLQSLVRTNSFKSNLYNNSDEKFVNIKIKIPQKSILLSPWLDLSLSNPKIKELEEKDPFLSYEILKKSALLYSGLIDFSEKEIQKELNNVLQNELKNPLLSPLFGDLNNLGKILIFTGTNEILYPDCLLLEQKAKNSQNTSVKLVIEKDFIHDWLVFPFPKKNKTFKQIKEFILKD